MDYSLCSQTVTVYRKTGETVTRQVAENCHLSVKISTPTEPYGKSLEKTFQLISPGDVPLMPGDRIYDGIGPKEVVWEAFIPALVDNLYEVGVAKPCRLAGEIAHWEAGNRKAVL